MNIALHCIGANELQSNTLLPAGLWLKVLSLDR
jgi:hypothetical protein